MKKQTQILALVILLNLTIQNVCLANINFYKDNEKETNLNYQLSDNNTINDSLNVQNVTNAPFSIELYGVDSTLSQSSTIAYKLKTDNQTSIGKWLKITPNTVDLDQKESKKINFTITPDKSAPPGVYIGAIVAEIANKNTDLKATGARASLRIIKPLNLEIPGEKINKYNFTSFSFDQKENPQKFVIGLKNLGNTLLEISGKIELDGYNIFPNQTIVIDKRIITKDSGSDSISIPLYKSIPSGIYNAKLILEVSEKDPFKDKTLILNQESSSINIQIIPFILILTVLGAFLLLSLLILFKHLLHRRALKLAKPYIAIANDNIVDLGTKFGINWKKLASFNKLKVPYLIHAGDKLLIPPSAKNQDLLK